jgi:hypothetical protein
MSFDHTTYGQAFAGPGMDTRQWVSYGFVAEDTPDARSVHFKDADGNLIPEGPLVSVVLQPSGVTVVCRVAAGVAGVGEGEWFPILQRDEVIVLIPEGDEKAGPVIVGRLNNQIDTWPSTVAGADATGNTFGFRRQRPPYILETASSYLVRSAATGAQIAIDTGGQIFLNNGDGARLFLGADAAGLTTPSGDTSLQLLVDDEQIAMVAGAATSFFMGASASQFTSRGTLGIGTSGVVSLGHAVTMEQVINLLFNYTVFLKTTGGVASLAAVTLTSATLDAAFALMVTGAASAAAPTSPVSAFFGNYASMPLTLGAIGTANLALTTQAANTDPTGFLPGVGRPGFMY